MEEYAYLIRYGVMGHVSRFRASPECEALLGRGQAVVIQSDRGIELGEVLVRLSDGAAAPPADQQRVVRSADLDDLARSRFAEALRSERFALCQRILREGEWPWELLDVEPMLDDRATVLHYLGPHRLDVATLRARFRMTCDFDVVLEPVGADVEVEDEDEFGDPGGCGSCGSGGGCGSCGSRGGLHQESSLEPTGPTPSAHSGCDSCAIRQLVATRGERPNGSRT